LIKPPDVCWSEAGRRGAASGHRRSAAGRDDPVAYKLAGLPIPTDDGRVGLRCAGSGAPGCRAEQEGPDYSRQDRGHGSVAGERLSKIGDRALLLIGFAGAFRRSELVAPDVEDVEEVPEGSVS
jgi:hypothetical protein